MSTYFGFDESDAIKIVMIHKFGCEKKFSGSIAPETSKLVPCLSAFLCIIALKRTCAWNNCSWKTKSV